MEMKSGLFWAFGAAEKKTGKEPSQLLNYATFFSTFVGKNFFKHFSKDILVSALKSYII